MKKPVKSKIFRSHVGMSTIFLKMADNLLKKGYKVKYVSMEKK